MTSKTKEYTRALDQVEEVANKRRDDALRLANWLGERVNDIAALWKSLDDHGLPPDALEELDEFRNMLDEGPPDGEGYAQPKEPQRARAPRKPCDECGNVGRHKVNPPCSKSGKPRPADLKRDPPADYGDPRTWLPESDPGFIHAQKEASDRGANAADRAQDGPRVDLADLYGQYKLLIESTPMLPSEAAKVLGVDLATLKAALEHSPS